MRTVTHHVDCDGYRFAHVASAVQIHPRMVRAECERCDWHGPTYGPAEAATARREANQHTEEVPCDGRCSSWT